MNNKHFTFLLVAIPMLISGCVTNTGQSGSGAGGVKPSPSDGQSVGRYSAPPQKWTAATNSSNTKPASGVSVATCTPPKHIEDLDNGTFVDKKNNLVWQKCGKGRQWKNNSCQGDEESATYHEALSYAKSNRFLGKSDWRLPSVKELLALEDVANLEKVCAFSYLHERVLKSGGYLYSWTTDVDSNNQHKRMLVDLRSVSLTVIPSERRFWEGVSWRSRPEDVRRDVHGSVLVNRVRLVRGGSNSAFERELAQVAPREKKNNEEMRDFQRNKQARAASENTTSYSPSYANKSYCGPSDVCFDVISRDKSDRAKIKCTKGNKIGQTYDICASSSGKWAYSCGAFGVSGAHYSFTKAGNMACE